MNDKDNSDLDNAGQKGKLSVKDDRLFVTPMIKIIVFNDEQILADSDRCCDDRAFYVGYT